MLRELCKLHMLTTLPAPALSDISYWKASIAEKVRVRAGFDVLSCINYETVTSLL